jgi:hypothetical protein
VVLYWVVLYWVVLYWVVLYWVVLYWVVFYLVVLHSVVVYGCWQLYTHEPDRPRFSEAVRYFSLNTIDSQEV